MFDRVEVRKVENGYVARYGKYTLNKEMLFTTFGKLVEWLEEYFDDVLGDSD